MAYHVYQTKAIIIESTPYDEASRSFTFLTETLGIISGTAQGIRKHQSKLKYHSSLYSLVDLSTVRGREKWRVTSLREVLKADPKSYKAWARIAKIITTLTDVSRSAKIESLPISVLELSENGQSDIQKTLSDLFFVAQAFHLYLASEKAEIETAEILTVYKILFILGYIDASSEFGEQLVKSMYSSSTSTNKNTEYSFSTNEINLTKQNRKAMVIAINQAIKELGL